MLDRVRTRGGARSSFIDRFPEPLGHHARRKRRPRKRPERLSRALMGEIIEMITEAMEPIAVGEECVFFLVTLPPEFLDHLASFDAEFEDLEDGCDQEAVDEREAVDEDGCESDYAV
jgi:hypothetical protein